MEVYWFYCLALHGVFPHGNNIVMLNSHTKDSSHIFFSLFCVAFELQKKHWCQIKEDP
jgi:hypothetical protein